MHLRNTGTGTGTCRQNNKLRQGTGLRLHGSEKRTQGNPANQKSRREKAKAPPARSI